MLPDFFETYANHQIEDLKAANASAQEIAKTQQDMKDMAEMVKNPVIHFFFTLLEPLPVALILTLISALILKRKIIPSVQ